MLLLLGLVEPSLPEPLPPPLLTPAISNRRRHLLHLSHSYAAEAPVKGFTGLGFPIPHNHRHHRRHNQPSSPSPSPPAAIAIATTRPPSLFHEAWLGFRVSRVRVFRRSVPRRTAGQPHRHRRLPVALVCLGLELWGFRCKEEENGEEGVRALGSRVWPSKPPLLVLYLLFFFPYFICHQYC